MSTPALETRVELNRNRLETMLKVLDVDGAVRRVSGGWVATGQEWEHDSERYARVDEARAREQQAMLDYLATDECRMVFLRRQLDDVGTEPCGRCDNCGGLSLAAAVSSAAETSARDALSRVGVPIAPRKMWPTGLDRMGIDLKGRLDHTAEEGRAVARLTDLGHGQALRDLFRAVPDSPSGVQDTEVPAGLGRAVVELLGDWAPVVDAIAYADSARRPALTRSLADGVSRFLGVPIVARWSIADADVAPEQGAMNSAQRVAAVSRRCRLDVDPSLGGEDDGPLSGRRVLLLDDQVGTGWTLTLAARALGLAGASAVIPLTLAVQS